MRKKVINMAIMAVASVPLLMACGNTAEPAANNAVISTAVVENTPTEVPQEETESVCAHEWKEATFSEPKTCTVCGETEGEPKQTYFEEHGALVKDAPVDCTVDMVICDRYHPEQQMVTDDTWQQLDCYSEPAEEDGYLLVHLELLGTYQCYYDSAKNIEYGAGNLMMNCYDWYTGRQFPFKDLEGDDAAEYTTMIDVDGVSYDVSYTMDAKWEFGDWIADASGDQYMDCFDYLTYIFKIPEGYDGLVFAAIPYPEYHEEDWDYENTDEGEKYAFDDEYVEGTVFFRFNKEGLAPLRQAEEESAPQ